MGCTGNILLPDSALLHDRRNDLYGELVQWTVSLGYGEPCTIHCPHYALQLLRLSCPCGAAMLLITPHVSGLLCHTHEPYGETNESVHH